MNAALIHLASIACWQRARTLFHSPALFVILQVITAGNHERGMRFTTLEAETCFHHEMLRAALKKLKVLGLIEVRNPGRRSKYYRLTAKGIELMTPRARSKEALA